MQDLKSFSPIENRISKIENLQNLMAILPSITIDRSSLLSRFFTPYQLLWIFAEDHLHAQNKQAIILAEKSVRIGWTYADAYKNVRKRLLFKNRDYLFATKDYPSALEYMRQCKMFAEAFNTFRSIISHGEDHLKVNRLDADGKSSAFTEEIKIGYIKFDNGSRIIAFSAHPQAMAVYGGDVGLDEFAKHPNAELLWQTAQGRVTWAYDMAVWSSHEGDDTLFNQFAQQARASLSSSSSSSSSSSIPDVAGAHSSSSYPASGDPDSTKSESRVTHHDSCPSPITNHESHPSHLSHASHSSHPVSSIQHPESDLSSSRITHHASRPTPTSPWNLYFRVTITDAIELGLLETINRVRNSNLTPAQFLAACRARAGLEQIFQQSYMCNPVPGGASIVDWSAIERCRSDYQIERVHLESDEITRLFGPFDPSTHEKRQSKLENYLRENFSSLLNPNRNLNRNPDSSSSPPIENRKSKIENFRLGFDIAASGTGDLSVIYIDEARADDLWLRALFTCRTEDWDFLKTVLFYFLEKLPRVRAAGDESGLGRQICWEASQQYSYKFTKVNFSSKKQDLGFALMNQLSVAEKHFPKEHPDIAADFFALRKIHTGAKWLFTEGRNNHNPPSHCDIAWAAALSSFAHIENDTGGVSAAVIHESGWFDGRQFHPFTS
jgi:phage FluMu gp28-like protein